jgi:plastocyanin
MWSSKSNLKSNHGIAVLALLWLAVACSVLQVAQGAALTVGPQVWTFNGPQAMTAEVGDVITFSWINNHSVFIHPTGDCDENGAIQVGSTADSAGASYEFKPADEGEVVFACDEAAHCENAAMIMTVTVSAAPVGGTASAPTTAPTWTPTAAPATGAPSAGVNSTASKLIAFVTLATALFTLV